MSPCQLTVLYGHLEGAGGDFARDPTGYLSLEAGIFREHGLEITWEHVQGTEERYHALQDGSAEISLLVGRASLQHFLASRSTRVLGAAMNSCPYYLMADASIKQLSDLKSHAVACREAPSRNAPIAETLYQLAQPRTGADVTIELTAGDQDAFELLVGGKIRAALLPRPFAFLAQQRGFVRRREWPDVVDDPLPITIETTAPLFYEREQDLRSFLTAHSAGIRYFKGHRSEALRILTARFGHSPALAEKILDEYVVCMDESLKVDFRHVELLLGQLLPGAAIDAWQVASEWVIPGALTTDSRASALRKPG
jgi:hypothetical protein